MELKIVQVNPIFPILVEFHTVLDTNFSTFGRISYCSRQIFPFSVEFHIVQDKPIFPFSVEFHIVHDKPIFPFSVTFHIVQDINFSIIGRIPHCSRH